MTLARDASNSNRIQPADNALTLDFIKGKGHGRVSAIALTVDVVNRCFPNSLFTKRFAFASRR